jgi:Domain of unknown function (DUF5615)
VTFLIDHQLPPALARWIADQPGVTGASHVADCGMTEAADTEIWQVCAERGWFLFPKTGISPICMLNAVLQDPRCSGCGLATAGGCNCWPLSGEPGRKS